MKSASVFKLFALFSVFLIGNVPISKIVYQSGNGTVISVTVAAALAFLAFTLTAFPFLKYPYITVGEYVKMKAGKVGKGVTSFVLLAFSVISLSSVLFGFVKFLSVTSLNFTPDSFAILAITSVAIAVSFTGIKNVLPLSAVVFAAFSLFALLMVLFSLPMMRSESFFPVFDEKSGNILSSAADIFLVLFADIILAVFVTGKEADGKRVYRAGVFAIIFWAAFTLVFTAIPRGIFGESLEIFQYPVFSALSAVKFLSFLPKASFVFQTLSFSAVLIKSAVTVTFAARAASDLFGAPKTKAAKLLCRILPASAAVIASSALIGINEKAFFLLNTAHAAAALATVILFAAINIKSYRRRR